MFFFSGKNISLMFLIMPKTIVIFQQSIPHYRVDFFNRLAKNVDLTVIHTDPNLDTSSFNFHSLFIQSYKLLGLFYIAGLRSTILSLKPDYVYILGNFRFLQVSLSFYLLRGLKYIFWGVDFGSHTLFDKYKILYLNLFNIPVVFYHDVIKKMFINSGLSASQAFSANNTIYNPLPCVSIDKNKNTFINVGSLDYRKRNDLLINVFSSILSNGFSNINLIFIGDGPCKKDLIKLARELRISSNVFFVSATSDYSLLLKYYSNAFASISYGQAGLAVLQSMSFGVPFITSTSAISGGEIHNIIPSFNGFLVGDENQLKSVMLSLIKDKDLQSRVSSNCINYYSNNATVSLMCSNFVNATTYYD